MGYSSSAVYALSTTEWIDSKTTAQMDFLGLFTLDQGTITVLVIVAILAFLGLSAFFSSSEVALFSLSSHRAEELAQEGTKADQTVQQLTEDSHRLLVTILVGNNLVKIAMASIATALLGLYVSDGTAVVIATFVITSLVILFGEISPRSYAIEHTESWAIRAAKPMKIVEYALLVLVVSFEFLTQQINRITGGRMDIETAYVTRQKITDIIETGGREGVLDKQERELLQRTIRFNDSIAKEAMTPRLDMTAIPKTDSIEEAIQTCIQSGHAQMPVYNDDVDNVIGVVHIRELVRDLNYGESDALELDDLIQPVLHVPESKNIDKLLREMRENRMHMVIVIDEFGTTEGLITMEDIAEKLVGEILDDDEEEPIEFVDESTVLVRGEVQIEEVNETLDIELPEGEEFDTIAGFIFNRTGRLVEPGEEITYDGNTIRVEQVDNTRIMKARIIREGEKESAAGTKHEETHL
jgi:putative hemolysin